MPIHVIIGPMFSGKSQHLQNIANRHASIGGRVLLITHPYARSSYSATPSVNHVCVSHLMDVDIDTIESYDVVLIDEAQFYQGLVEFALWVGEDKNKILHVSGLDGDYQRIRFGEILDCIPIADTVERLTGFCTECCNGTPGLFTYRKDVTIGDQIVPGGEKMYTTLCRACYVRHLEIDGAN